MKKIYIVVDWLDGEHYFTTKENAQNFIQTMREDLAKYGLTFDNGKMDDESTGDVKFRSLQKVSTFADPQGYAVSIKLIEMSADKAYEPRKYNGNVIKPTIVKEV